MDETPIFSPSSPPPQPRPARGWLGIVIVAFIVLCLLVLTIGVPVAGVLVVNTQVANISATVTGHANVTQTSVAMQAQPPAGWTKIIGDPFLSNKNDWDIEPFEFPEAKAALSIEDGKLVYKVDRMLEDSLYYERPDLLNRKEAGRFFLAVEARQLGGSVMVNSYGLFFRDLSDTEFSVFEVQDSGYITVKTDNDGEWDHHIPWTRVPSFKRGEMNRFVVLADQGEYTFMVNNEVVGRVDSLSIREGLVAIFVSGRAENGVTYEFDNFQLYVP